MLPQHIIVFSQVFCLGLFISIYLVSSLFCVWPCSEITSPLPFQTSHVLENISNNAANHSRFQPDNKKPQEISRRFKVRKYLSTKWNRVDSTFVAGLVIEPIILIFYLNVTWGQEIIAIDGSVHAVYILCVKFYTHFPKMCLYFLVYFCLYFLTCTFHDLFLV